MQDNLNTLKDWQKDDFKKQMHGESPTSPSDSLQPTWQMTFGEKLVGLTFNPSGDDKVAKAKQLCAQLADLVFDEFKQKESSQLSIQLYDHTIGEILNAQMNVVKLLTLKY